jgi:DNA-binding transcriptional MerR regulator
LIGLQRRAIQFYTKEGVIKPLSGGGIRGQACIYSRENMIEFGIIKQLAAFGMTVQKIKKIISELKKPEHSGLDRYHRRIIRSEDGKCHNPYVTFYFKVTSMLMIFQRSMNRVVLKKEL